MRTDQKEQLSDEEYAEYLAQSESFCGRLWANLNAQADCTTDTSEFSISELYESFAEEEEHEELERVTTAEDHRLSVEFTDPVLLSSTIIVGEDTEVEFFDFSDEDGDFGRRSTGVLAEQLKSSRTTPTTNPCA